MEINKLCLQAWKMCLRIEREGLTKQNVEMGNIIHGQMKKEITHRLNTTAGGSCTIKC